MVHLFSCGRSVQSLGIAVCVEEEFFNKNAGHWWNSGVRLCLERERDSGMLRVASFSSSLPTLHKLYINKFVL